MSLDIICFVFFFNFTEMQFAYQEMQSLFRGEKNGLSFDSLWTYVTTTPINI